MSFHGNQIRDILAILMLETFFQMEQHGTFLENFKYHYWSLHKIVGYDSSPPFLINVLISPLILVLEY